MIRKQTTKIQCPKKPRPSKSFNAQVNDMACKRLKLKRRERIVLFRFSGFLIRNDLPFKYSIDAMIENTDFSRSSIFESINVLESRRIIERIGYTNRVKYQKGSIMIRICTLVQNRITKQHIAYQIELVKYNTLVQKLDKLGLTSPETGYSKTNKLKRTKDSAHATSTSTPVNMEWHNYKKTIENDRFLGLSSGDVIILSEQEWLDSQ